MKIACIGDSLTEGDYGVSGKVGIADIHKENYPYFLAKMTGDTVLNFGKCGARAGTYLSQYEKLNPDLSDVSLVLVMLGTNGGFDKDADTPDNRAFETLLARLHQDAPHARILLCTPPHVTENPALSGCGLSARVEKSVAYVRDFAAKNGYPLLETARIPDFCAENESLYQANDGVHFVEAGYRRLAAFFAEAIKPYRA